MPPTRRKSSQVDSTPALIKDLIIVQLGLAGVGQREIRQIVGGDMNRITRFVKLLRPKRGASRKGDR